MSETARECVLRLFKLGWDSDEICQHRDFRAAVERERVFFERPEMCAMAPYQEEE